MNIYNLRKKLGLTQMRFAAILKVSYPTISRWERKLGNPNHVHLIKLIKYAKKNNITINIEDLL